MQFNRRNINKKLRNGDIISSSLYSTSSSGGGSSSGGVLSGNYLPATLNPDGTYTVNLTQVNFNGNVIASGEVSAFRIGSSSATTGTSTSGTVTIYDGLDSDSALIALSANQGRILKELIQSMSGGTSINIVIDEDSLSNNQILVYNSTTKQWENKSNEGVSEITKLKDVQLTTLSDKQILQYDSASSKWINKTFDLESSAMTQHIADTVKHITADERNKWNSAVTSSHTHSNKTVLDKITDAKLTNWDGVVANWDKAFYFDKDGNLRVKLNLIGEKEVSAYGSGSSTSTGAITIVDNLNSTLVDAALSANQGRVLKDMIDSANLGEFDLSGYSKTSHTHSNYSVTSHTHSNYSTTGHTHTIANIDNLQSTLDGKSGTGHTHSYASTVKVGTTSYNVNSNIISIPAYPTLSTLGGASSTDLENHTANTTAHITSTERTNWNDANTKKHTHSNKSVLDKITDAKISNWDKVYEDWNDVFTIDTNGNLKVKVNLIGQGEISAYGSGSSTSTGAITIVDNLNSTLVDAALSANQGRVLKDMIDSANLGDFDLSGYSKTSHTHSNYSVTSHTHSNYSTTGHTHSIANITNLQSTLDGKSGTGHTHSAYSPTSHTHSNYSVTSHTHSNYVDLTSVQEITGRKDFKGGIRLYIGNSITDENGYGVVGVNPTGWTGLPSDGTAIGLGTTTSPLYLRSNGTLKHYRADKSTSYTIIDSSNSAHTHSNYATTTNFNSHSANTTAHITSTERTNWNDANSKKHSHSNKSVLDGITSTKVSNWDKVYEDWNDVFEFDTNGNLKVKVNVIGQGEISAYGSGTSTSSGAITIVDNLTSTLTDAALSANQGRVLKDMFDSANFGEFDLSGYSKTSHTHSNYSVTSHTHSNYSTTGHTHSIANITNLQSSLDAKSGTGHTHSAYSPTSHTHSNYSVTSHTHSNYSTTGHTHSTYYDSAISRTANTVLAAPNGSGGTATFRSLVAADIPTLAISKISNLQSSLDAKSGTRHTHSNYSPTGHTHSISNITNLQSTLDGKSGTGHSHSNYSVTSHTHSNYSTTGHTHSYVPLSASTTTLVSNAQSGVINFNSTASDTGIRLYNGGNNKGGVWWGSTTGMYLYNTASAKYIGVLDNGTPYYFDGTSNRTLVHSNNSGHTHNYAGSSSAGGAATSANKVNSTLSFSAGTFSANSFNGSAAKTVYVPTHTSHITNNSGFITSGATVAKANQLTNSRTLWGQSFNGTANVGGTITGSYFKINDTSTNPYLQLTQGSTWYLQGYNGYLYMGAGSSKSLRIDSNGNCYSVGEVTSYSDKRLKDNIQPLENRGYVQPYTYDKDGKKSIGFLAQDMQELYPELVSVDESTEEKYLSINYMQYTAVLQQQIIDLKKEIDELKDIIKEIKK